MTRLSHVIRAGYTSCISRAVQELTGKAPYKSVNFAQANSVAWGRADLVEKCPDDLVLAIRWGTCRFSAVFAMLLAIVIFCRAGIVSDCCTLLPIDINSAVYRASENVR